MGMHSRYELPALGYGYDALEPAYTAEALELHHAGHHKAYVDGANKALDSLADIRSRGDFTRLNQLEKDLAFNVSGHILHSIFWRNLEPNDGAPPAGRLESRIRSAFGGTDAFKRQFCAAGAALQGSGWVTLSWEVSRGALQIHQIHDHQSNAATATMPLLVMDMWEHAYYLQYHNQRERWIVKFWDLINWADVARRFDNAECSDLALDPEEMRGTSVVRLRQV